MHEAYPLHWPVDYKRTPAYRRKRSQFKNTIGGARDGLKEEVRRLGATDLIISSNIPLKNNGDLRADFGRFRIDDPGVAIYFRWNKKDISMVCDQYLNVWENIVALQKAIEAIRGLERWGVSEFLDRAFTGFQALPESTQFEKNIWDVLGLNVKPENVETVKTAYKTKAFILHPDKPTGSTEAFVELQNAYERALKFYQ
jgi:hypothetical protein